MYEVFERKRMERYVELGHALECAYEHSMLTGRSRLVWRDGKPIARVMALDTDLAKAVTETAETLSSFP